MSSDGRDRMESIWNQIASWWSTTWTDEDKADRAFQKITDDGIDNYIDPLPGVPFPEAASANYNALKDEFGLTTQTEEAKEGRDFEDRALEAAVDEAEDQIEEYGISAVADAFEKKAPPELQQRFDDLLDEFPPDVYETAAFNEINRVIENMSIDAELISTARLERLQQAEKRGSRDPTPEQLRQAEEQVVERLERAFGLRFDDLEDALDRIQQRVADLQGVDRKSSPIRLKGRRDAPPRVTLDPGFAEYRDEVIREVETTIDVDAASDRLNRPSDVERIGTLEIYEGDIHEIDLIPGREEFGEAPEFTEDERQQLRDEQAESEAAALADDLLESMEG